MAKKLKKNAHKHMPRVIRSEKAYRREPRVRPSESAFINCGFYIEDIQIEGDKTQSQAA